MKRAFPTLENSGSGMELTDTGMSLRDYFAAKAMQGIMSNDQLLRASSAWHPDGGEASIAQIAYDQADAMLAAREAK